MSKKIISFVPATLGLALTLGGSVVSGRSARAADDCITQPNAQTQGSHWYYHTDRVNNRKCWYQRSADGQILQGSENASQDVGDDAPEVQQPTSADAAQAAAPAKPEIAPRAAAPKPHARISRSDAAPPAQRSTGAMPMPYGTSSYPAAWPWPGDLRSAAPAPTSSMAPAAQMTDGQALTNAPVSQTAAPQASDSQSSGSQVSASQTPDSYDAPTQGAPLRAQSAPLNMQASDQRPTRMSAEQTQNQMQTDPTSVDTGESALAMLQKSLQRLTAPTVPGGEPDHTAALATAALALFTIGIGIVIAARWSQRNEGQEQEQDQPRARWDIGAESLSALDMNTLDMSELDMRDRNVNARDINALNLNDWRMGNQDTGDYVRGPRHYDDLAAAIEAVKAVRYAKVTQNVGRQPDPARSEPAHERSPRSQRPNESFLRHATRDQERMYPQAGREMSYEHMRDQEPFAAAADQNPSIAPSDPPISTRIVENTLRQLLQELDTKRSQGVETRSRVVRELSTGPKTSSPADQFGRPNRNRMRHA
jgi:hypothetical protein